MQERKSPNPPGCQEVPAVVAVLWVTPACLERDQSHPLVPYTANVCWWELQPCCGARAGHEGLSLISATVSLGPSGVAPASLVLTSVGHTSSRAVAGGDQAF